MSQGLFQGRRQILSPFFWPRVLRFSSTDVAIYADSNFLPGYLLRLVNYQRSHHYCGETMDALHRS